MESRNLGIRSRRFFFRIVTRLFPCGEFDANDPCEWITGQPGTGDKMSIAMEKFGSNEESSESRASSRPNNSLFPYRMECRTCGFEPLVGNAPPSRCPKCGGHSWQRFVFPRSLLMHVDRKGSNSPASRASGVDAM
jgi:hypothetical protein